MSRRPWTPQMRRVAEVVVAGLAAITIGGAVATTGVGAQTAWSGAGQAKASFACPFRWELQDGQRLGYITAGDSADCAGDSGSLTLSARLLRRNPQTGTWHTDKAQTRTWHNLRANRYVELDEPCTASTVRAVFTWTLRNTGKAIVSRYSLRTPSLVVPGPDCRIVLSGPGVPPA